MSDFSNYLENAICNHFFRNSSTTSPAVVYLALFSAVTDSEAGTGTELAQTGYARQAITFGAPTNGAIANTNTITFGPITSGGNGQSATHAAIFDSLTTGNALSVIKPLSASVTFNQGDSIQFATGQVTFTVA